MPWLCEGFPLGLLVGFSIWWKLSGKMGIWERGEGAEVFAWTDVG